MPKLSKRLSLLLLILGIFALEGFLYLSPLPLLHSLEHKINDAMFWWRGTKEGNPNIIIVDIDEKSLQALGQWPWERDKVAQILKNLTQAGAGIIGLDVVFAEEDASSPHRVVKNLGLNLPDAPNHDAILAEVWASSPVVAGYVFAMNDDGIAPQGAPNSKAIIIERHKSEDSYLPKPHRAILNIPLLQESAYSSGYFNTIPDDDGVVRSIPLVMEFEGVLYPTLSLEMIRLALGVSRLEIDYFDKGIQSITLGDLTIPTDAFGRMRINYTGGAHNYLYLSALDIYENRFTREQVEGKAILLGTSSTGLLDLRSTPFESVYPGVEVHANALDNLLSGDFIARPLWSVGADVMTLLALPLLGGAILFIPSVLLASLGMAILLGGLWGAHYYLMFFEGVILHTLTPLLSLIALFVGGMIINYFFESRQKELIKAKFARKVSPAVVEELVSSASPLSLEGKESEITIFFSDVRDFTSISERLKSPQELIALLNDYMTPMVDIITAHHGTVDKFIGDAVMAYWNAPRAIPHHADEALSAAIEQIEGLIPLNERFKAENRPLIRIGIGLNSGVCVVGEMGSLGRSDYTCIGDPVNLASRIEGLCKGYGALILLSEYTLDLLEDPAKYALREVDFVRVKGKEKPVRIYECIGWKDKTWKENPPAFSEALALYREAEFAKALEIFSALEERLKEPLYALYTQRCRHYIAEPPENFDGVFAYKTK